VWGSAIDFFGLRVGMLLAVAVWTGASMSHALMSSFLGFALARAVLGLGEGATFPGGLRTAVETLPAHLRARGIALSFSGGTIGANNVNQGGNKKNGYYYGIRSAEGISLGPKRLQSRHCLGTGGLRTNSGNEQGDFVHPDPAAAPNGGTGFGLAQQTPEPLPIGV
jgi:hypothetical protein